MGFTYFCFLITLAWLFAFIPWWRSVYRQGANSELLITTRMLTSAVLVGCAVYLTALPFFDYLFSLTTETDIKAVAGKFWHGTLLVCLSFLLAVL